MIRRTIIISAAFVGLSVAAQAADFGAKRSGGADGSDCCEPYRFVYGEFWYGSQKLVAPVRHGPLGDEVGLPGGAWLPCQFSCEITLRKQHLNYMESQGAGSTPQSPDYPRADSYVDGWGWRHGYLF